MFPMLMSCIKASVLLHQFQRMIDSNGNLIANEDDYVTAYHVMLRPISEQLGGGVSKVATDYWEYLRLTFGESNFVVRDVLNRDDNPKGQDRTYSLVKELSRSNCLTVAGKDRNANIYKISRSPDEASDNLPSPEFLFRDSDRKSVKLPDIEQIPINSVVSHSGA